MILHGIVIISPCKLGTLCRANHIGSAVGICGIGIGGIPAAGIDIALIHTNWNGPTHRA